MRVRYNILITSITILVILMALIKIAPAKAATTSVVISEISMGSEDSASEEFVELYNNSQSDLDISDWGIYYKSSSGKTWTKKYTFASSTIIKAHDFITVSTLTGSTYTLSSGMAQTAGSMQIKDSIGTTIDLVGWGSSDAYETKAVTAAQASESLYRQFDESNKTFVDTDNNLDDYFITRNITPNSVPKTEIAAPDETISYSSLILSEIFPDPASPQTDSNDEFIEIYNPTDNEVDLSGWVLKDSGGTSFVIKDKAIAPHGYLAISAAESSISLNNTGDVISLFDPSGTLQDESVDYGAAESGLSWGFVGGTWVWTSTPTPNNSNSTAIVLAGQSTTAKKSTATKAKKAATKKVAKAKTAKAASAKIAKDASAQPNTTSSSQNNNWWSWLLIALGLGTIGYGIYEYRPEIANFYYRLKAKFRSSS